MTEIEIRFFGDAAWVLLQLMGIAVLCFAVRQVVRMQGPARKQTVGGSGSADVFD